MYHWLIGIMVRLFTSGPRNWGSILGRVIQKTQKWYLMPPCLTHYMVRIKGKWNNPGKGVVSSPTPRSTYIYICKYIGCKLLFRQIWLKAMKLYFLLPYFLASFLVSGSNWYRSWPKFCFQGLSIISTDHLWVIFCGHCLNKEQEKNLKKGNFRSL